MSDLDGLFDELDEALRQRAIERGGKQAEAFEDRKSRLEETRKALEGLFRSSCPSKRLRMYRPLIESFNVDRDDLPKAILDRLAPDEPGAFRSRIGFVRASMLTAAAPALRGFVGHMIGLVFERTDRFAILVFGSLDMDMGSLTPFEDTLQRIEAAGPDDLRKQEAAVATAFATGLARMIRYVNEENP